MAEPTESNPSKRQDADWRIGPEERDAALNKIERLLRKAERDSRLLDGRDFKMRRWAEAYRLLDLLREIEP